MSVSDVNLGVLPDVLQDLVVSFAFNLPKDEVVQSLDVILSIIDMNLPFFFFREAIWSWHYGQFLPNPVFTFMPINYYNGTYAELFDDDAMCWVPVSPEEEIYPALRVTPMGWSWALFSATPRSLTA